MKYIIGNWKANKTIAQAQEWMKLFEEKIQQDAKVLTLLKENKLHIILCPPYHLLQNLLSLKKYPNIFIGLQDISIFNPGSYTGEIPAELVSDIITHAIIGHSERRVYFEETEERIQKKVENATKSHMISILCVRNEHDKIYQTASIVAYEPITAIGTGLSTSIEEVLEMKSRLSVTKDQLFLYGGSVTKQNCFTYLENERIDGLLIGSASLDAVHFYEIISTLV